MSEAYMECLKALPFGEGYSDTLSDNPVLQSIKNLQEEVKRLNDENDALEEQLTTIRNAVQPQEDGSYYINVEGAVAETIWNTIPRRIKGVMEGEWRKFTQVGAKRHYSDGLSISQYMEIEEEMAKAAQDKGSDG